MKLATYRRDFSMSCGIVTDDGIIDIPDHSQQTDKIYSIKQVLTTGDEALEQLHRLEETVQSRIPLESVSLLGPIPDSGKLLALAGNYKKHLEETAWQDGTFDDQATTTNPWPFLMPTTVVTGHKTVVPWPAYSEQVDYEIELAVVIGKSLHCADPEACLKGIAGYTIANDISARSTTFKEGRKERPRDAFFDWLMGKWSDGFLPLGPWLVTADEISDPQNLEMELTVNGQTRQKSNTSRMIFSVGQIISFISHLMTLEPGDVIITGTPHGVGVADGRFLEPGDVMECTIGGIGTLTNMLGAKPETLYEGFIHRTGD